MNAPPGIVWDEDASLFVDQLVDRDIAYLDAQIAIESLIHAGLHDEVTVTFDVARHTVHWHRMPALHRGLRPLDIFTTVKQSGLVHVLLIRFGDTQDSA